MEMQPSKPTPEPPVNPGPGYPPPPGYSPSPGYPPAPGYPPPAGYQRAQATYGFPMYAPASAFPGQMTSAQLVEGQPNAPGSVVWMPAPPVPPKCPPGLEYLSQIDQILIQQQIELMEMITGFETCNRYDIKNTLGQWVYFAAEENDDFTVNCYGPSRPFTIKLFDSVGQAVVEVTRNFQCTCCCCPCICCLQELEVQAPPGTVIGYVKQKWHPCLPKFIIQNEAREDMLKIVAPCVPCRCCEDIHFEVKALDGKSAVGRISRQWTGYVREASTDASNFAIQFPVDLDIKMKAMIIGSCFLFDFMFFERAGNSNAANKRRKGRLHAGAGHRMHAGAGHRMHRRHRH